MSKQPRKTETLLAHLGRAPYTDFGTVNPPVYHASTILFDSLEAYETKVSMSSKRCENVTAPLL